MSNKLSKNMSNDSRTRREREDKVMMKSNLINERMQEETMRQKKMIEDAVVSLCKRGRAFVEYEFNGGIGAVLLQVEGDSIRVNAYLHESTKDIEAVSDEGMHISSEIVELYKDADRVDAILDEREQIWSHELRECHAELASNNGMIRVGRFKYCDIVYMTFTNKRGLDLSLDYMSKYTEYKASGDERADWYYVSLKLAGVTMMNSSSNRDLSDLFGGTALEKMFNNYVNVYFNTRTAQFGFSFEEGNTEIHFVNPGITTMSDDFSEFGMVYNCEDGCFQFKLRYMLAHCTDNFKTYLLMFFKTLYENGQQFDGDTYEVLTKHGMYLE